MAHDWELTSINDYNQKWHCRRCDHYVNMRGAKPPEPESLVWAPFLGIGEHLTCEEAQIFQVQDS